MVSKMWENRREILLIKFQFFFLILNKLDFHLMLCKCFNKDVSKIHIVVFNWLFSYSSILLIKKFFKILLNGKFF